MILYIKGFMEIITCLCEIQSETKLSVIQALELYWNWQA